MYPSPESAGLARVFAGPASAALDSLRALDREWHLAVRPGLDHGLAHTKLAWWRLELNRLQEGAPEHPLTRSLKAQAKAPVDFGLLGARLDAADLALGGFAPASLAELEALTARSHGSLWQLAAALLAPGAAAPVLAGAATLGRALGLIAYRDTAAATLPGLDAVPLTARATTLLDASEVALPAHGLPQLAALSIVRALARRIPPPGGRGAPGRFVQLWIAWRAARLAHHVGSP